MLLSLVLLKKNPNHTLPINQLSAPSGTPLILPTKSFNPISKLAWQNGTVHVHIAVTETLFLVIFSLLSFVNDLVPNHSQIKSLVSKVQNYVLERYIPKESNTFLFIFLKKKKDDVMVKFSEFRYTHGLSMLHNQFSIFLFPARVQLEDLHTCCTRT